MKQYFLKCDISGIQSFIFNVPSDGAARALKSRSIYVQNIADDCLRQLKDFFKNDVVKELYNGGGNFYLEIGTDRAKEEIDVKIREISNEYLKRDIFPYIAYIEKNTKSISDLLNEVNQKVQKTKMQRPIAFDLLDAKPEEIKNDIFKEKDINGQIPQEDNKPLEFKEIAELSKGDSKLAALKLDVDNLGSLFRDRTENEYKKLSDALKDFFDKELLQLIKDLKMQQNIYVVFSGGDDCFLIGTWEKVLDLAVALRRKFAEFQRDLKTKIVSLPQDDMTFSAGIIVFQPHFPMLQLAEEVEEALSASKRVEGKNSVTIFGKTLKWEEFEKAQELSTTLEQLINNPDERSRENKSLLQIFRLVYPQTKEMPKVWRLKYYLRRNINEKNRETVKQIFDEYSQALLFKHIGNKAKNPDVYLVASRWAELLLK